MSVFGRTAVAAVVLTGSVAAAAIAANNDGFYSAVKGSVSNLAGQLVTASSMMSGDDHLFDPAMEGEKVYEDRIASSSVVTHVEVIGGGPKQRIVLLNPQGQEVFSHDPEANTTIVAKDAIIPSITVRETPSSTAELRVVTAAPKIEAPEELREALVAGVSDEPELFYREDL